MDYSFYIHELSVLFKNSLSLIITGDKVFIKNLNSGPFKKNQLSLIFAIIGFFEIKLPMG